MDLNIKSKFFIVGGATSGFGKAISLLLMNEGANVLGIARNKVNLLEIEKLYPNQFSFVAGDLSQDETIDEVYDKVQGQELTGIVINAGGPPATRAIETTMQQWDDAYNLVLRWKIQFTQKFLPLLLANHYGRIIYIESASTKQPIENLVLSNSMRMAVVGFVKTLSQEIGKSGVTLNVMAPGYHLTSAAKRVIVKKSETEGITYEDAKAAIEKNINAKEMGSPEDFASLAAWLLSPYSQYINGQTISVDGGIVKSSFG